MKRPEEALHRAVATFLDVALPFDAVWWHTPNGGGRSRAEAGILKALGVKRGVPDVCLLYGGRPMFVELKAGGGVLNDSQRAMRERIERAGGKWTLARTLPEVAAALRAWDVPLRATVNA